ncbi:hypothetical protein FHS43_006924 [Streptosporangium becharense]|uniref:Uncharacterized protein n=1 Tax=Streptosporangium becharense TaxID=1816182 RepID=A0A7W9IAA6_9ACTN|nr:hypothetical protein [Streptosporangium becharense]MBB2915601.1 hypothetical protein [Streptosporangium becharense]MBB5817042.1 hypothetical protein [Streptosporangium becharense]
MCCQLCRLSLADTAAREETLATRTDLERVRQRHDQQTRRLPARLIQARTPHEADQDPLAGLHGRQEDLNAGHAAPHAKTHDFRWAAPAQGAHRRFPRW